MSVAVDLWRALERWNPLQERAADGTWGDGAGRLLGDQGVAYMGRNDDGGFNLGLGSVQFRGRGRVDEDDDSGDVFGHTAQLSPAAAQELHTRLTAATAAGKRRQSEVDAHWDEHGEVPADAGDYVIASGYVSGDGADVHYSVELDDPSVGVETYLAVIPHSSDATIDDLRGADQAAVFDPAEMRRFLARLGTLASTTESAALDLWHTLEARHNVRGPDGRFVSIGGGGPDRPSLADVIRGTAALGPKRQRDGKGGMSVADAVRSAARRSDSTGRPTQRTPAQHRAEGAHEVADEVDRALAEAGVPEDVRRQVAARARAIADGHGPRKRARADSVSPSHETAIRDAYAQTARMPGDWVPLAEIRDRLSGLDRADQDAALERLAMQPGVQIIPWDNAKALTPRDREAALRFGGEDNHNLRIEPAALQAATPAVAKPKRSPARMDADRLVAIDGELNAATSTDEARARLASLTAAQLRQVASFSGVSVGSGDTKARLLNRIVDATTGRRLDAAAIDRMTRR